MFWMYDLTSGGRDTLESRGPYDGGGARDGVVAVVGVIVDVLAWLVCENDGCIVWPMAELYPRIAPDAAGGGLDGGGNDDLRRGARSTGRAT